jgi:hypothetical protein
LQLGSHQTGFNNHRNSSCPKCEHKPFTEDICKPNKTMRTTVKTWLKNQEKAKPDGQDKADVREEPVVQPNTDNPIPNGDAQKDVTVNAETMTEAQPPGDVVESEETPAADLQPSIEVSSFCTQSFLPSGLTSSGT